MTQWGGNERTVDAADLHKAFGLEEAKRSRICSSDTQEHRLYCEILP